MGFNIFFPTLHNLFNISEVKDDASYNLVFYISFKGN